MNKGITKHKFTIFSPERFAFLTLLILLKVFGVSEAYAHQQPTTIVLLDVTPNLVRMELKIPVNELELAFGHEASQNPEALLERLKPQFTDYLLSHINPRTVAGNSWLVRVTEMKVEPKEQTETGSYQEMTVFIDLLPPAGASTRQFILNYDVIMHSVFTHRALVSIGNDWEAGSIGQTPIETGFIMVDNNTRKPFPLEINLAKGSLWKGSAAMLNLGMQHIKEGTDHLLFILVLLLPAPLLSAKKHWQEFGSVRYSITKLLRIVTAFTLGHSLTLLISALGGWRLLQQPVEVMIAFSILVSAIHAVRPIFPGKEAYVAASFGLVHGLAFATVLSELNLDAETMILSILSFNSGIELMQVFIIALIMPWLILMSRTVIYSPVRIGGAILASIAALAWIAERISGSSNFIGDFIKNNSHYAYFGILVLIATAVLAFCLPNLRSVKTRTYKGVQ